MELEVEYVYRYTKDNTEYMKDFHKNKELSYLKNWDVICMVGQYFNFMKIS